MHRMSSAVRFGFVRCLTIAGISLLLAACSGGGSSSGSGTGGSSGPAVVSKSPSAGATKVPLSTTITATFNEDVNSLSVQAGFTVSRTSDSQMVPGTVTYNSSTWTATFTPNSALQEYTQYTASLYLISDSTGHYISPAYTWNFTTADLTPPVTTASSSGGLYNTALSIVLSCTDTGSGCAKTYYSLDGSTPSLVYSGPIALGEGITTLKFYSVDNEGQKEATQSDTYTIDLTPPTVVTPTTPTASATSVTVNTPIVAKFSEALDTTTINSTTFYLDHNMPGTVTYNSSTDTATLTPEAPLSCNTTYTATIATGVHDLAGNAMSANYVWTFTTSADCTAPVTSASPDGGVFTGTSTSVSLACTDATSGCKEIVYTTDGTLPTFSPANGTVVSGSSAGPISIGLGDTVLRFRSEDNAGNEEVVREKVFSVSNTGYLYVATSNGLARGAGQIPSSFVNILGGNRAKGVFYDSSNGRLYRVGTGGAYGSDNDGASWTKLVKTAGARAIYANGNRVYLGANAGLLVSNDDLQTYVTRTTSDGLGSDTVFGVAVNGNMVYVATAGGLSISSDYGVSFQNKTTADGLGNNNVVGVYVDGSNVYAATSGGLSISTDGGASFTNRTTADGLGSSSVNAVVASGADVYVGDAAGVSVSTNGGTAFTAVSVSGASVKAIGFSGTNVYAGTGSGLYISTDGGSTFPTLRTTSDGLRESNVRGIFVQGGTVYLATDGGYAGQGGISITTDGGTTFQNNGLGGTDVAGVYANGTTIYAATADGFSVSTDGGNTFVSRTMADGMGDNLCTSLFVQGGSIYIGTINGMAVSSDGGSTFVNKTTANGLGSNNVADVAGDGTSIYVATDSGLSVTATKGPTEYTNWTTSNGLPSDVIDGVWADSGNLYVGTNGGGLAISTNGGSSWTTNTYNYVVYGVYASGSYVQLAGPGTLGTSTDGGANFTDNSAYASATGGSVPIAVTGQGSYVYADDGNGLALSADNGTTFVKRGASSGVSGTTSDASYTP